MFPPAGKRPFTIESLVSKESPKRPQEPVSPPLLTYRRSTCADALVERLGGPPGVSLRPSPDFGYPSLGGAPRQPPVPLFGVQQGEQLAFCPWLIGSRFEGSCVSQEGLLLHGPFSRKAKRIRTAFSPSQLLQLERAFEKNHYVVGTERKQLANNLGLSETQVKVWFQNRRTKHKRQKLEEEGVGGQEKKSNHHISMWRLAIGQEDPAHADVMVD